MHKGNLNTPSQKKKNKIKSRVGGKWYTIQTCVSFSLQIQKSRSLRIGWTCVIESKTSEKKYF